MVTAGAQSEQQSVVDVEHRLKQRFPAVSGDVIHELTAAEFQAFATARVRDFVPVLAERNVVKRLTGPRSSAPAR